MNIAKFGMGLGVLLLGFGVNGPIRAQEKAPGNDKDLVQLGMPATLFQGIPEWQQKVGVAPFLKMMKTHTGLDGNVNFIPDAMTLAEQIHSGKIQIGVFQGHEFAFAKDKYPDLMAIAVSVPLQPNQAFCVVLWNCKADNIGALKDEKISIPPIHRDYCEMYLAKQKQEHMKGANFAGQLSASTSLDAIQDVIDAKCGCTVVDRATINYFEKVYPGQFKNVKILCQSEPFPNACVVVKKNELDEKTIALFRKALFNAPNDPIGKPMLATWKLKGFEKVPDDYELQLKKVLKTYPNLPTSRASNSK